MQDANASNFQWAKVLNGNTQLHQHTGFSQKENAIRKIWFTPDASSIVSLHTCTSPGLAVDAASSLAAEHTCVELGLETGCARPRVLLVASDAALAKAIRANRNWRCPPRGHVHGPGVRLHPCVAWNFGSASDHMYSKRKLVRVKGFSLW